MRIHYAAAMTLAALAMTSTPAIADEGVLEINQQCALNGGCFSGDTAGFPVTIGGTGSYKLTSGLDVAVAAVSDSSNTTAIRVTATDVTIDLNGFTVQGPVTCSGTPVSSCTNAGGGEGIELEASGATVKNGTIEGVGFAAIVLRDVQETTVRNMKLIENGDAGIVGFDTSKGVQSRVVGVLAKRNQAQGVDVARESTLKDVTAIGNGLVGIDTGRGSTVVRSKSINNGGPGINADRGSLVKENVANANGTSSLATSGIFLGVGAMGVDNVARNNTDLGIQCVSPATGEHEASVRGNLLVGNNSTTIQLGGNCRKVADNICNSSAC